MKQFGLCLLGRSIVDVVFSEMMYPFAHAMGVARCAHAGEIIIKARIAEQHPLLIFAKLPKPKSQSLLGLRVLMAEGRTLMYNELPDVLWAVTGYRIPNRQRFESFGRLRNTITHLGVPGKTDLSKETLQFAFRVLRPMIEDFWKVDIFDYIEEYEPEIQEEGYVQEQLKRYRIPLKTR
jgi:hypothetical protein